MLDQMTEMQKGLALSGAILILGLTAICGFCAWLWRKDNRNGGL